ncbi:glucan 1,4-alpha-glucosidase [Gandjariella thermophila]|uniref:Glucan 1,4-alpha-glucosidase n=1 Tax=Gandjariella thermophila TaxID=1931992 RepID=A0A4D4JC55_9PSEU|nr:glucan 1,4-alpha-glucosidase [Gandjariella thermophila]
MIALLLSCAAGAAANGGQAPGGPGAPSFFDLGRKDCVGTATGTASKVWFTVAGGVLSDVYEPTVDNTNVGTLQYVVTDGSTFTDLQTRDLTYTVAADPTGMSCTVTATSTRHHYQLVTTYLTDPARDTVLMRTRLVAGAPGLRLYARLDAHVNGNGGGGPDNGGADTGTVTTVDGAAVPVVSDTATVSQAANRDYAVPTFAALRSTAATGSASVGYAGTASDGLTALDATHTLGATYASAPNGHVVAVQDVTPRAGQDVTLALGFGRTGADAVATAGASLSRPFDAVQADYQRGWRDYDATLRRPPAAWRDAYYTSANVLKASEDKTFPGAIAASLASPWGQAVSAGALVGGKPVYFGSYRETFARDLYETFTGLLVDGDLATARDTVRFLFGRQQLPDGEMPRNSLPNGKTAPDTGGRQLDETAYPILMADQAGLGGDGALWTDHIRRAADFLVAHGPSDGVERWEEQSGYSPSTIAAEIAGLTSAARIATRHGDTDRAALYQATADHFQRSVKAWTVTTTGPYAPRYFTRLSKTGDPNAAISYNLGNGGPTVDQRAVVDGGFQELVRLGELPADDPDVRASLTVLDRQIGVHTPSGTGYYRYGTSASAGSADGYGDCYQPSQTSCRVPGAPWPPGNVGTGHLWPVLSGERAETALAAGDTATAGALLAAMTRFSSGVGLVPEQAWEDPDLPPSAYGSDPTTASIGFTTGKAAGSASPLTWAQAQELRLIVDLDAGRTLERPDATTARYVDHAAPVALGVTVSASADGSVTGTAPAGAHVVVGAADTTTGDPAGTASTTAGRDGRFAVTVPIGFGSNVVTATATTADGTGYAQTSVVGNAVAGTTVLDAADPSGDDNGPGTYQYPTASDFAAGSFDITRFQVVNAGTTVYLRTTLRALVPTFGNTMGAQLLDVYVHIPGAAATSTAAAFPSRDYTIASGDAWSQRLEVQGFADPVWVDAGGGVRGTAGVVASTTDRTITIAVPTARFGTPGQGWSFTVVLHGQDGYRAGEARGFAPTAQPYLFGVCPPGGTAPVCSADPAGVPRAVDVLTPAGVDQAAELDPTRGPVTIHGVPVP